MVDAPAPRGASRAGRAPSGQSAAPGTSRAGRVPPPGSPSSQPSGLPDTGNGWHSPTREPGRPQRAAAATGRREPGLPGWLALLVLLVIAGIGGAVDVISGSNVRGGFNVGLVVASVVAIVLVRRRSMLTIVVAPPLVYAVASGVLLYVRAGGPNNRKVLLDAAVNWLVYGFPSMAIATAAVLVIAGIRVLRARRDATAHRGV